MLALREIETVEMRMADGVRLVADLYRPAGPGRYPVLVMRLPYGRKVASTVVLAHPAWYAAQGYLVLVQDVRGRGQSEGLFRVLEDDVSDGAETLAFAAGLAGGNGQVATYGFSYHGMNQFMGLAGALRAGTKRPDAMAVAMAAWSVRDHWAFEGDAFRLQANQSWACQMATETARRAGDDEAAQALRAAHDALHLGPVSARPDVLGEHARYTHYGDWLADDPAYWRRVSPGGALAGLPLDVPVLHIGGWHDTMLQGTLAAHAAFSAGRARQRLAIGPWTHLPWGRRLGALDAGAGAASGIDTDIVAFFDETLKGRDNPRPAVRLYDAGQAAWRGFDGWPHAATRSLALASTGRAAPTTTDGQLLAGPAADPACDHLVHDPWRPAPSIGLHLGAPSAYVDRSAVHDRSDVATYTSPPLDAPLTLLGAPRLDLAVTGDGPSFDLDCTLSMVAGDGAAIAIISAHRLFDRPAPGDPARIDFRPTCLTVPAGHRLRLSIQASAFPAFAVNPGTGARATDTPLTEARVTTLRFHLGGETPSALELPVHGCGEDP